MSDVWPPLLEHVADTPQEPHKPTIQGSPLTPEFIRKWIRPEETAHIARFVQERRCTCCGYDECTKYGALLECGHYLCHLCIHREHICIACALAV